MSVLGKGISFDGSSAFIRGALFMLLLCGTVFAYAEWHGIIPPPWCVANPFSEGK